MHRINRIRPTDRNPAANGLPLTTTKTFSCPPMTSSSKKKSEAFQGLQPKLVSDQQLQQQLQQQHSLDCQVGERVSYREVMLHHWAEFGTGSFCCRTGHLRLTKISEASEQPTLIWTNQAQMMQPYLPVAVALPGQV